MPEIFSTRPWPFEGDEFPEDLGAVVQTTVATGVMPALVVIHTDENAWLVEDGVNDPNQPGAAEVAHLRHVVERNSSVASLADLPPGWEAVRDGPGRPWTRRPHVWPE